MNILTGRVGGAVGPMIGSGWNYKNIIIAMTTIVLHRENKCAISTHKNVLNQCLQFQHVAHVLNRKVC